MKIKKIYVFAAIMGIMLTGCGKEANSNTLDYSKEIVVSFSGTEGNSLVELSTIEDGYIAELKNYAEKEIERLSGGVPLNPLMDKMQAVSHGYFYTCTTDADLGNLHNGDTITYACHVSPEIKEEFNIKEVNMTFSKTVSGLKTTE